jgi:hypothetical protein
MEILQPLTRPSATLSPSDGERDRVRGHLGIAFGKQLCEAHRDSGFAILDPLTPNVLAEERHALKS